MCPHCIPPILPRTTLHTYLLAFACEDVDIPETRADGKRGERGESSSGLGIATFAFGEPAKFYLIFD